IMRAQDVGWHTNSLVLGKHSGRNAFRTRLQELGIQFETETELNEAFTRFKALADLKHEIFDEDLQAIASDTKQKEEIGRYGLACMQGCSEAGVVPGAKLTLTVDGEERTVEAERSGPVDAAFKAIESLVDPGCNLQLYSVNNITSGTDAQGEVTVRLERGGRIVNGVGSDTDIIIASVKAYIEEIGRASCRESV